MDYSSANHELWNVIIQIGYIAVSLIVSNYLCRKVTWIKKSMMPVAVLAGFLLLIAKYLGLKVDLPLLEIFVFHGIALGFIAMSLRVPTKQEGKEKDYRGLKSGAIIVSTYLIQGAVGLLISLVLSYTIMPSLFKAAGLLLPMGYGQGPGQANNIGSTYEALGFHGGRSFGMAIAAMGYLVACIVGVILLNRLRSQGKLEVIKHTEIEADGNMYIEKIEGDITDSIDILSIQMALVLVVYFLTFLLLNGITTCISSFLSGLANLLNPLIWGFNFIIASAIAILVRSLIVKYRDPVVTTNQNQNNYLLNRISGFFFDIMIVAGIASINFEDIQNLWLPFILMTVCGAIVTWFYLKYICKKVYKDYYYQGLISMFGMLTGTISSGILLLREIDGEFSTPAANNLITGSSFGIVLGAPLLVLVGLAARSELLCWITLGIILVYAGLLIAIIQYPFGKRR
ncbi:MAG: hypothetical protein IKE51_06005 [Solobacterium sp.]|nr:hypothetical protein [Solobacterium sp.]